MQQKLNFTGQNVCDNSFCSMYIVLLPHNEVTYSNTQFFGQIFLLMRCPEPELFISCPGLFFCVASRWRFFRIPAARTITLANLLKCAVSFNQIIKLIQTNLLQVGQWSFLSVMETERL